MSAGTNRLLMGVISIQVRYRQIRRAAFAVVGALAIAAPAGAAAQEVGAGDPADAQYGPPVRELQGGGDTGDAGDAVATGDADDPGTGALPFSGLQLGLMGAAAAGLAGIGLGVRRLSSRTEGDAPATDA